jgi:hypothetical protein
MINIDDRLLSYVDSNEFWLLMQLAKRISSQKKVCWPSNKTLCKDTKWNIDKLQRVKKSLVDRGLLTVQRKRDNSNIYQIKTNHIGYYVNVTDVEFEEKEGSTVEYGKGSTGFEPSTSTVKSSNEVLTSEVLTIEPSEAIASGELFSAIGKKKKGTKEVDPNYKPFVKAWCERYPILGFNATSGKKIKELIEDTRAVLIKRELVPTDEKMIESFRYVLDYVRDSNHFIHGKVITTFQQQYRSVMNEITNGGKKQQRSGVDSAGKQILEQVYNITTAR